MAHATHHSMRAQGHRDHAEKLNALAGVSEADRKQDVSLIKKAVLQHEKNDHPGTKPTRLKLKTGGVAEGESAKKRLDRASGGRAKHKGKGTNVNVIIAPQGGGAGSGPGAMPPRPPMPPMGGPPPGAGAPPGGMPPGMPPRPPMGPPVGAGAPGMPPMAPHNRGGRAYAKGGSIRDGFGEDKDIGVHMTAGAASGEGREEKLASYGKNSMKKEKA